jgi:hypothetical protein
LPGHAIGREERHGQLQIRLVEAEIAHICRGLPIGGCILCGGYEPRKHDSTKQLSRFVLRVFVGGSEQPRLKLRQ